jgi:hypothetical protein
MVSKWSRNQDSVGEILKNKNLLNYYKGTNRKEFCFTEIIFNVELKELSSKYRAKVLLIAFDSLHLRSDRQGGPLAQVLFVQYLCA